MRVHTLPVLTASADCGMFMIDPRQDRRYFGEPVYHLLKVEEQSQWKVTGAVLLLDASVVGAGAMGDLGKMRSWMASWSP